MIMRAKFVYESLGLDLENDSIVDMDNEVVVEKYPRFLLHVSEPEFRDKIFSEGLLPQDANKAKWGKLAKAAEKDILFKNSIFATPFKDSIDVYDIKNIHKRIFALPMVEEYLSPEDIEKMDELMLKMGEDYAEEIRRIKKEVPEKNHSLYIGGFNEEFNERWSTVISNFITAHANIDIWIIDTKGLPNKWYKDIFGGGEEESILTHEPIPPHYLELLFEE